MGNTEEKVSTTKGKHITVLLNEMIENINVKPDGIYVDCTLGGGGHSALLCSKLNDDGLLIGIDQDEYALGIASQRLRGVQCQTKFVHDSFFNLKSILNDLGIEEIDGIIFDLGVSSFQFDNADRGFSYQNDGPLDMRMDRRSDFNASDIVNSYSKDELVRVFKTYGEERFAARIADRIIKERETKRIETTTELAELIKAAYPAKERFKEKHPSRQVFQSLRIEVNNELTYLEDAVRTAIDSLKPGGRIGIITFHSLEDRIIKQLFNELRDPCTCPKSFPVCICGKKPVIKKITGKPIIPKENELENNRRARSAKLRIAEKI